MRAEVRVHRTGRRDVRVAFACPHPHPLAILVSAPRELFTPELDAPGGLTTGHSPGTRQTLPTGAWGKQKGLQ